jgi:hypothetical protein
MAAMQAFTKAGCPHLRTKEDESTPAKLAVTATYLGIQHNSITWLNVQGSIYLYHLTGNFVARNAVTERIALAAIEGQVGAADS